MLWACVGSRSCGVPVKFWKGKTAYIELGNSNRVVGMSGADGYALRFYGLVNRETNSTLEVLGCVSEANISIEYRAMLH